MSTSSQMDYKKLLRDFKVAEVTGACANIDREDALEKFSFVAGMLKKIENLQDSEFYKNMINLLAEHAVEGILNSPIEQQEAFFNHYNDQQICEAQLKFVLEASKEACQNLAKPDKIAGHAAVIDASKGRAR